MKSKQLNTETPPIDAYLFYRSFFEATKPLYEAGDLENYAKINYYLHNWAFNDVYPDFTEESMIVKSLFLVCEKQIKASIANYQKAKKCGEYGKLGAEYGKLGAEYGKLGGRPKKEQEETPLEGAENNPPLGGIDNPPLIYNINKNKNNNINNDINNDIVLSCLAQSQKNEIEQQPQNNNNSDSMPNSFQEVFSFYHSECLPITPQRFLKYASSHDWTDNNGEKIKNWKGAYIKLCEQATPEEQYNENLNFQECFEEWQNS